MDDNHFEPGVPWSLLFFRDALSPIEWKVIEEVGGTKAQDGVMSMRARKFEPLPDGWISIESATGAPMRIPGHLVLLVLLDVRDPPPLGFAPPETPPPSPQ